MEQALAPLRQEQPEVYQSFSHVMDSLGAIQLNTLEVAGAQFLQPSGLDELNVKFHNREMPGQGGWRGALRGMTAANVEADGMATARVAVGFPDNLVPVTIRRRANRFAVDAERGGRPVRLHLPNSGRMAELLVDGASGLAALRPGLRTQGTLYAIRHGGRWVSVDARMPNRLLEAAVTAGALPAFEGWTVERREVRWKAGRVDFLLRRVRPAAAEAPRALVETKSCNLVEGGVALFPDGPTLRGTRHLAELEAALEAGYRAAVVWFVQRDDAGRLRPHTGADPAFAGALRRAVAAGVEAYAYRCRVTPRGVTVLDRIPVEPG